MWRRFEGERVTTAVIFTTLEGQCQCLLATASRNGAGGRLGVNLTQSAPVPR